MSRPAIALVSGYWSTNIGNAFFNLGGKHVLERAFPNAKVEFIQDQPGYQTFNDQRRGNPANALTLIERVDADFIALQGPVFTETLPALWEPTMKVLMQRGIGVIYLGAALFRYSSSEIATAREFLDRYPPAMLVTRDSASHEALKGIRAPMYSGIDSAFFVPDAFRPFELTGNPFVIMNFDRRPEPNVSVAPVLDGDVTVVGDYSFVALGMDWRLNLPSRIDGLARRGKVAAYLGSLLDRRVLPSRIAEYEVIRPEHRANPYVGPKIYRRANGIVSDEPYTYLTLYAGTRLTLSDRVHACVATLAYGNPAMLFSRSPRSALFDRLGLADIRNGPVRLDRAKLEDEKAQEVEVLQRSLSLR